MSWLFNTGDGPRIQEVPDENKVEDYSGRRVENKKANQPFLSYTEFRRKKEKEQQAWAARMKERDEKIARGEKVGPAEADPTEPVEVGCLGLMKFLLYVVLFVVLTGKLITGDFLWENESILPALKSLWPTDHRLFSEAGLKDYDGSDPLRPIYIAIDSDVYDVSEGRRTYGPGGSYHFMAGRDAARAFATGCFGTHRTHDVRGLTEKEEKGLEHWKSFFANHKKYFKVGRVVHPPIDPNTPIPEPCQPVQAAEEETAKKDTSERKHKAEEKHEEL